MSKSRTRSRKLKHQQQTRRQQVRIAASLGGVFIMGIIAFLLMRPATPPKIDSSRLDLDPILGDPDAPVTIVEYGAYSCHGFQALHESGIIEDILAVYDGRVNFIFRDFPVIMPTYDHMAAEVAQCVLDQDEEAFWQFHDLLYTEFYANRNRDQLVSGAAERTGVNEGELASCVDALTHYQTVQYDLQRGSQLAIRGTPALFINGQPVYSLSRQGIIQMIEAALAS